jgi:Raf kinase inhibitor-like YbhB/YbcL family protein
MRLEVTSSAFGANQLIPPEFTCDGANKPPPIAWSGVPKETQSIAILVDDPDAPGGTFTHWLITDLPATTTSLSEGGALPRGAMASRNDMGKAGYAGPCPPSGRHHYHFHVYALDAPVGKAADRQAFLSAIPGHVLAEGDLVGVYQRR